MGILNCRQKSSGLFAGRKPLHRETRSASLLGYGCLFKLFATVAKTYGARVWELARDPTLANRVLAKPLPEVFEGWKFPASWASRWSDPDWSKETQSSERDPAVAS